MATLLAITVLLPLVGALALVLTPGLDTRASRQIALGFALASFAASVVLLLNFDPSITTPQFAFGPPEGPYGLKWLDRPDIRFSLGLDGLSIWLFMLSGLLTIVGILFSWEAITERAPLFYCFMLALQAGLLGLFASLDVILFYICFELILIPLFFIIGLWGGSERRRAAVTFFLYTLAGSLLTFLGVLALVVIHQQYSIDHRLTFSIPELTQGLARLEWQEWHRIDSWTSPQVFIFLLLLAGFAVKVPLFPVHSWLPLAHVEAPTAGSILLAGVLLKVGSYGLIRFNMAMVPLGAVALFPLLTTLAVIGIIYGALVSLAQTDMKKLVAYSSVSHMGFIVLGIMAMNDTGLSGSMIQMVNHGVSTGALFACVGALYVRYHTRDMGQINGVWARMPLFAFFMIVTALGSAALPGLNGFTGEFPILAGMFATSARAAVLSTAGMILGAYYLLWMTRLVIFGPLHKPLEAGETPGHGHAPLPPLGWHEIAGLAPLVFLMFWIGILPETFFSKMRPAIEVVDRGIQAQRALVEPGAEPGPGVPPAVTLRSRDESR